MSDNICIDPRVQTIPETLMCEIPANPRQGVRAKTSSPPQNNVNQALASSLNSGGQRVVLSDYTRLLYPNALPENSPHVRSITQQDGVVPVKFQTRFYQLVLLNLGVPGIARQFYLKSLPACFAVKQGIY